MYADKIKEKMFSWGGKASATNIAAHGLVSIVGSVAGGSMAAKSEEFAKVHAAMLLEGTKSHSKKDLQILLDAIGASLSFNATNERLIFSGKVRAAHLEKLLTSIAEALTEPTFPTAELKALKKREEANLALEEQEPNAQARIHLTRLLYKKGHPNFSDTTQESRRALAKINSKTLLQFHKKILNGKTLILSVAGDIAPQKAFNLTEKYFKKLPRENTVTKKYPKVSATKAKKIFTRIKHKASVDFMLGVTTGIIKDNTDYPALVLGMQILGGSGFTGRLMQTVREKEGLTYGVAGYLAGFENLADGFISFWGTFAPQLLQKGRESILRQIKKILSPPTEGGVTDEEVKKHALMYEANRRVRMSNSGAFASAAHTLALEGRKPSYLEEFPKKILKLTAREVNAALKKYLKPELLSESSAGPVSKE